MNKNESAKLAFGEKILFLIVGALITLVVGYFAWVIGDGIYCIEYPSRELRDAYSSL